MHPLLLNSNGSVFQLNQLKSFSASNELSCLWTNRSPDDFISFCPYWPLLGNEFHPPILLAINFDYCRNYSTYENMLLLKQLLNVEGYAKNWLLSQDLAITIKFTVFTLRSWNLVKMITSWVGNIDWISAWLGQNCGLFTISQNLWLGNFLHTLYHGLFIV